MTVQVCSFSYRRGLPDDPTGNGNAPVADFFAKFPDKVNAFLDASETLIRQSIEEYKHDGRDHLQVAFGCTGGQHRSVYFAERMAERLSGIDGVEVEMKHTAIGKCLGHSNG